MEEIKGLRQYVTIKGHVKRPGVYELFEDNMTAYDLIFKAGGFDDPLFRSQTFLDRADLIRFDKDRITQSVISFNLKDVLSSKSNDENFILFPGDVINIYSEKVLNNRQFVLINGVENPGQYDYKSNMKLKDLILEAGGFETDVYRYKVEIARINPRNESFEEYAKSQSFTMDKEFFISDLVGIEDSSTKNNYELNVYDIISIRPDPYFLSKNL